MIRHQSLPNYPKEKLAQWIAENRIDARIHTEKTELTEEDISDYEHRSALASRAIDRLNVVKESFMDFLKNGTPFNSDQQYEPVDITIPGTKGLKELEANRKFACEILEKGYTEEQIEISMIPWPEASLVIAVNSEGIEYENYTRPMTVQEINAFKPMLRGGEEDDDLPLR